MKTEIKEIIDRLIQDEEFQNNVQKELRTFVTNTSNPLDERFDIWSKWCTKEHHRWLLHKGEYGFVGDIVDEECDYFDRGAKYNFEWFLDRVEESFKDPKYSSLEHGPKTLEEFKESLIEHNFGSFTYDW